MRSAGHRMRHHIAVDVLRRSYRIVGKFLEQPDHAARRLFGGRQIFERRLVGGSFHGARIGQNRALGNALRTQQYALSGLGRPFTAGNSPSHHGGGTQKCANDRCRASPVEFDTQARQMTTCDMPGFMRQNADHHVGGRCLGQQPGVDENALTTGHEGVDPRIADQIHPHRSRIDPRRLENRPRIKPHQALDLGITDDVGPAALLGLGSSRHNGAALQRHKCRHDQCENTADPTHLRHKPLQ